MPSEKGRAVDPRYGWVMVAVAPLFFGLAGGSLNAISVFIKPLASELGWLRGETAFAYLTAATAVGVGAAAVATVCLFIFILCLGGGKRKFIDMHRAMLATSVYHG